ncbi:MAG: beta-ketoacyl-ACP synthase 3 [Planctomycetota bacterium]
MSQAPAQPAATTGLKPDDLGPAERVRLYRWLALSRRVDLKQRDLTSAGEALFHMPTAGHEGVAALGLFLTPDDWCHVHYRSKALLVARGLDLPQYFHSLLSNANDDNLGRMMGCFHADPEKHIAPMVVPTGNHALHAVGVAQQLVEDARRENRENHAIVVCGVGDGTTQQGEVLEAIAEAVRQQLPVLFYVEDNGFAISTQTRRNTFFDLPGGPANEFYGLPIHRFDAVDVRPELAGIGDIVQSVRDTQSPGLMVLRCERLTNHTNADDQRIYRTPEDLEQAKASRDPVSIFRGKLIELGDLDAADVAKLDAEIDADVTHAAELARRVGEPETILDAKRPLPESLTDPNAEYVGNAGVDEPLMMIEAMRQTLRHRLEADPAVTLLGEDVEDPKGDVFGLTRGLSTDFPGRVQNTALTEATIVGTAIGRAMVGGRPVAFCQFADFLPNGINQVLSELGTIYWRTGGRFECPVILMVTCGGYRPGLGPFHAQTFESLLAHVPGVDVFMPSDAGDAAGLLNAAFESKRPTVFLYPKVCLNDRSRVTSNDVDQQVVIPGTARRLREGNDLTLVAWGSTVGLALDATSTIQDQTDRTLDVFDLRSIDPWDAEAVAESAKHTGKLAVVHEDNLTAGFGAEVVAEVVERCAKDGVSVVARRIARPDVPIPQNFANQLEVLPSYRRTLSVCCEMLGLDLSFDADIAEGGEVETIPIPGSSPADQVVTVTEWLCQVGDAIKAGQHVADLEADKAVFEFAAPADGVVEDLILPEGEQVDVGSPMMKLRKSAAEAKAEDAPADPMDAPVFKRELRENQGKPRLTDPGKTQDAPPKRRSEDATVYLSPITVVEGKQRLTNDDLIRRFPDRSDDDIVKRTGIESRPIVGPDQTALSMAIEAATAALEQEHLTLDDITGIVCHTTTPPLNTPSMACMTLAGLDEKRLAADPSLKPAQCMVYDVNAACSGWLYALDAAYNTVRDDPDATLLVVTTEALSRVVNPTDFDTAILFADAATATVVRGLRAHNEPGDAERNAELPAGSFVLTKPVLSGKADPQRILTVGFQGQGHIEMDGKKVFVEGVRAMTDMTQRAFAAVGRDVNDCDWLVPHQANRRIFEAVRKKLHVPEAKVIDEIADHGNTSSSSIPLSLAKRSGDLQAGQTIGLCAFGGGFTFGAAILEAV